MTKEKIKKTISVSLEKDQEIVKQIINAVEKSGRKPDNEDKGIVSLFWEQFGVFTMPDIEELVQSIFPFTKGQRDRQELWQYLARENKSLEYEMQLIATKQSSLSKKLRDVATATFRARYQNFVKKG